MAEPGMSQRDRDLVLPHVLHQILKDTPFEGITSTLSARPLAPTNGVGE